MTIKAIKSNPHCELAPYFAVARNVARIPTQPPVTIKSAGGKFPAHHTHHVSGGTSRKDHVSNLVRVNHHVHDWLHVHKYAGQVLCCYEMRKQGRLDWSALGEFSGMNWPGCLERDCVVSDCAGYPWIEKMRRELVG